MKTMIRSLGPWIVCGSLLMATGCCTTTSKTAMLPMSHFPSLAGTGSYYAVKVGVEKYLAESFRQDGDWLILKGWPQPQSFSNRPKQDASEVVYIPLSAVESMEKREWAKGAVPITPRQDTKQ